MNKRTAVVTGGNRGIGYAVGEALAQQGFRVVLVIRDGATGGVPGNRRASAQRRRVAMPGSTSSGQLAPIATDAELAGQLWHQALKLTGSDAG